MTDTEILEKYGSVKCEFSRCYKNTFTYEDLNRTFTVYGTAEYRGEFEKIMTVGDLWSELETFNLFHNK